MFLSNNGGIAVELAYALLTYLGGAKMQITTAATDTQCLYLGRIGLVRSLQKMQPISRVSPFLPLLIGQSIFKTRVSSIKKKKGIASSFHILWL